MGFSDRLAKLGIELPPVTAPVATYILATRPGDVIRTSGQLPFIDGALPAKGKVGSDVLAKGAKGLAHMAALNALAAAAALTGGLGGLSRVVHVTVSVSSTPDFTGQAAVVNGVSEVLRGVFGEAGRHSRSAVGVAAFPLGTPVEIKIQSATVQEFQLREGRVDGSAV